MAAFPDPNGGLIHAENTVIVDRDGRIAEMFPDPSWLPAQILATVDANGRAVNPLARLNLWLSSRAVALFGDGVAGFSGLTDLAVALLIFAAFGYLVYRFARKIFAHGV